MYEIVDPVEWTIIRDAIDEDFGQGVTKELSKNLMPVVIRREKDSAYFLVPMDWTQHLPEDFSGFEVYSMGIPIGTMTGERFRIALQILERLAVITESRVVVSRKGAEAFTYGRSILKESIHEVAPNLTRGQRVIIFNRAGDCLGLASMTVDSSDVDSLGSDRLVAKNLADIGWYLRRYT